MVQGLDKQTGQTWWCEAEACWHCVDVGATRSALLCGVRSSLPELVAATELAAESGKDMGDVGSVNSTSPSCTLLLPLALSSGLLRKIPPKSPFPLQSRLDRPPAR